MATMTETRRWLDREVPQPWSEQFTLGSRRELIRFPAAEFQQWCSEVCPEATAEPREVGDYVLTLRPFPVWTEKRSHVIAFLAIPLREPVTVRSTLTVYTSRSQAYQVAFDDVVHLPTLRHKRTEEIWMSLTPSEIRTQLPQIRRARGNVAVAGCGLGWAAMRILERPSVKHVTLIDKDPAVLELFGWRLKQRFGCRLTLVCADAYAVDYSGYDVVLWDIWQGVGDAAYDNKFLVLREQIRRSGRVCEGWTCWRGRD